MARSLESSSTASGLSAGGVSWDWGNILNASDLHSGASEGAEGGLGSWSWGLGALSSGSSQLDVEGVDVEGLALLSDVDGSEHSGIRGRLITISLDLHSSSDSGESFASREISNVDEGIVEGSEDVSNSEDAGSRGDLGDEGDLLGDDLSRLLLGHTD